MKRSYNTMNNKNSTIKKCSCEDNQAAYDEIVIIIIIIIKHIL